MIKLNLRVSKKISIAVSGGVDSMAALDFIRNSGKRDVQVLHFNHGTSHGKDAEDFVTSYCLDNKIDLKIGRISESKPNGSSQEDFWRTERYKWLDGLSCGDIVTCHHLNDAVEWWIFTSLRGNPRIIPSRRGKYIRPFLTNQKSVLKDWCIKKKIPWIEDPSNEETKHSRNYIRHILVPHATHVNPGLDKIIKKKIELQNR